MPKYKRVQVDFVFLLCKKSNVACDIYKREQADLMPDCDTLMPLFKGVTCAT